MESSEPAQPESREIPPQRYPFHIGGRLYLPLETALPTDQCIRCQHPPAETVAKAIRHPKSITSWFAKAPTTEIALCRKHLEDRRIAHALTWSVLGLGALLLVVGIVSVNFVTIVLGLIAGFGSGLFRAQETIQGRDVGDGIYEITGATDAFVRRLPEHEHVEEE